MSYSSGAPQPYPPMQPKKTPKWVIVAAVIGGLLVIGMIGSALGGGHEPSTVATVEPVASITDRADQHRAAGRRSDHPRARGRERSHECNMSTL